MDMAHRVGSVLVGVSETRVASTSAFGLREEEERATSGRAPPNAHLVTVGMVLYVFMSFMAHPSTSMEHTEP